MADAFAANPHVEDLSAALRSVATRDTGPAPTLFPGGDLPRATASGNPPSQLMNLPWKLRHAAAEASQAEWAMLMNNYGKGVPDADLLAEFDPAAHHPGNADYEGRVRAWARGR